MRFSLFLQKEREAAAKKRSSEELEGSGAEGEKGKK
jgi:hypothetical protein